MKRSLILMHIAVFLWGFTGVLGRAITLDSVMLVWWRLFITAVSLWILYLVQSKLRPLSIKAITQISLVGTLLALHWVCFYGSIKLANVTIALTCLSTTAFLSALLEPLITKRPVDLVEIFLGLLAIAGIVIIYNTHLEFSSGIVVGLLAAVFTVLVSVFNKTMIDKHPPEQITIFQLSGGFLGLTILLPVFNYFFGSAWAVPKGEDVLWLLILSWVCTICTFFLYIRALKKLSAFTTNLLLTLEPIYGIVLAFFIYKENKLLSNWFYLGFALIILAVVLHSFRVLRNSPKAEPESGFISSAENL